MRFALTLPIIFLVQFSLYAQFPQFQYVGNSTALNNISVDGNFLGGLSGIAYDESSNRFVAITDNSKNANKNNSKESIIFSFSLNVQDTNVIVQDIQMMMLMQPVHEINAEAIRISEGNYIIADEGENDTKILKISKEGDLIQELYREEEINFNRGFEGVALSGDGQHLFFSLERPFTVDAVRGEEENLGVVPVFQYDLKSNEVIGQYLYPLHLPPKDEGLSPDQEDSFREDNGVTEILFFNDSTLLFLERAFLGGKEKKLHVRLYAAKFSEDNNLFSGNFELLEPVEVFNLYSPDLPFEVDNVEGMTFGKDKKYLYLVSDDNFDTYGEQVTQVICLKLLDLP